MFPAAFRGHDGAVAVYFEAAAVITVLVLLGQVLELRAREATSGAIRALLDLAPKTARRVSADGGDEEVPLDSVAVGDRLRVRPGEKMPVDGEVIEGRSIDRRIDGHRRIDAGDARSSAARSSPARSINPAHSDAVPARSAATPCSPASCRWWRRRSARARRSSGSPTRSRAGSCRWSSLLPSSRFAWATFGPEPRLPTASSPR